MDVKKTALSKFIYDDYLTSVKLMSFAVFKSLKEFVNNTHVNG